jgi:hypothetical protein
MKKLLILILLLFTVQVRAQSPADEQTVLHVVIEDAQKKINDAAVARSTADSARKKLADMKADTSAAAKKEGTAKLDSMYKAAEEIAKKKEQDAVVAKSILARLHGDAVHVYKTDSGATVGMWLVVGTLVLALTLVAILISALKSKGGFDFREALSENLQEKVIEANPGYQHLPEIIKSLSSVSSDCMKRLSELAESDKIAGAEASRKREEADKNLESAKLAFATDATKEQEKKEAEQAAIDGRAEETKLLAVADASSKAVLAVTLSPAMLVNLASLFPPTYEVSNMVRSGTEGTVSTSYRASASRLIAFISAMLLFIVGLSASCFFLYFYMANGVAPDLSKLSAVLIALGIGMAPYAVNKVANAAGDKDKTI